MPHPHLPATVRLGRRILAIFATAVVAVGLLSTTAGADGPGSRLYTPTSSNESNAYARMIELHHAGKANGRLLATFEHWTNDGTPAEFIIRSSDDGGKSFSTLSTVTDPLRQTGHPVSHFWQPSLYEFGHRIAGYPAGTLLLMGNLVPADSSYTEFFSWRSTDHGKTWRPIGIVQKGGPGGTGIWEPFITTDARGELVTFFSDERDFPRHSQMLDEIISTDGGQHWSTPVRVVASALPADRPGMATVARMGAHGKYAMSFELCGRVNCEVHVKFSADGRNWGPARDVGTKVVTTDGRYFGHSPTITWVSGRLVLAAQNVFSTGTNQPTGENYRAIFTNNHFGRGPWSWSPAPWTVSHSSSDCNANYSPWLLPTDDGRVRYTAPVSIGTSGPCAEATGVGGVGTLPVRDTFATTGGAGWNTYGGTWSARGGSYTVTAGGEVGPKALIGSTGWRNYTVTADVTITSASGDAGVIARVSNPAVGVDSYDGYLAFFDVGAKTLDLAREDGGYEPFASVRVPVSAGTTYRLSLRVQGSRLTTSITPAAGGATTRLSFTDPYASFGSGLAGLRDHAGTATFSQVRITR